MSNQLFSLTLDDLSPLPPREKKIFAAGVYVILPHDPESVNPVYIGPDPVYVGQSGDVYQRLTAHKRTKRWFPKDACVLFYDAPKLDDRLVLETCLILRYRPRQNRAIKIGLSAEGRLFEIQFIRGKK
jgi:hypothetical protein